jgi:hypothetical protein
VPGGDQVDQRVRAALVWRAIVGSLGAIGSIVEPGRMQATSDTGTSKRFMRRC